MATLTSVAIVFVHADLLIRHQYLAGPLRKGGDKCSPKKTAVICHPTKNPPQQYRAETPPDFRRSEGKDAMVN